MLCVLRHLTASEEVSHIGTSVIPSSLPFSTSTLVLSRARALTRISKTGVQDSHFAKSRSSTRKSGSPIPKSGSPTNSRISLRVVVYLIIL